MPTKTNPEMVTLAAVQKAVTEVMVNTTFGNSEMVVKAVMTKLNAAPEKPKKMFNDDMRPPLEALLKEYMVRCGTDLSGAVRDALTELYRVCEDNHLDFEERMAGMRAVIAEEEEEGK